MEFATAITVALLSLMGITFGGFWSFMAAKHSRQANDAVNHTDIEGKRIYELAMQNHELLEQIAARLDEAADD